MDRSRVDADTEDGVLILTLRHPGRRNALTWKMYDELSSQLEGATGARTLRAVVLRGTAEDGFAAGTDITQFGDFSDKQDGLEYEHRVGEILSQLQHASVPTVAMVQGHAVGAGLAIAASCDFVIAEQGASFGAPIARTLGNCLPAPVVARLMNRLGTSTTLRMLLAAQLISAEELASSGFVYRVVDPGEGMGVVHQLLAGVRRSAPLTLAALKETIRRIEDASPVPDNDDLLALCYGSADFAEGVEAFRAKRHPVWEGK